ncbi:hypothetical protein [Thermogutta sp.]|uniref:hypothetical protein n=1 Tax=Thermogutta sp. TaxID=1962930 RepID=UPI0032204BC8
MAEASESTSKQRAESDPWSKLAEILGLRPGESNASSAEPSTDATATGEGTATHPAETSSEIRTSREETRGVPTTQVSAKPAGTIPLEAIPDRIPLRRWTPRTPSGGNWDDIAAQLGLRPKESPATAEEAKPGEISAEGKEEKGTCQTTAPHPAALEWLAPVAQTIAPVPFEEASLVAVTLPPEEEAREVVQAEVVPEGNWLEEQVVAPGARENPPAAFAPVVEEILTPASVGRAVAADTATLQPVVTDVPASGSAAMEAEALPGEKKKRRRRRRKKRSGVAPVSPEPFEEELPEIVELAVSGAEGNGETGESSEKAVASQVVHEEPETGSPRKRRSDPSVTSAAEEEENQEAEDEEIPRPSHKAVPGWAEVVGYVIQKNLEARNRRSGYGSRDRRR